MDILTEADSVLPELIKEAGMEIRDILVDFNKYCPLCKNYEKADYEEPCNECLEHCVNSQSEKPVNFDQG